MTVGEQQFMRWHAGPRCMPLIDSVTVAGMTYYALPLIDSVTVTGMTYYALLLIDSVTVMMYYAM